MSRIEQVTGDFENPEEYQLDQRFNPFRGMIELNPPRLGGIGSSKPFYIPQIGRAVIQLAEHFYTISSFDNVPVLEIVGGRFKTRPLKESFGGLRVCLYGPSLEMFGNEDVYAAMELGGKTLEAEKDWLSLWDAETEFPEAYFEIKNENRKSQFELESELFITSTSLESLQLPEFYFTKQK